ncbi:GGDEF domain-containing protein [Vibrio ulleungensis]|uniref:diguanylate cyclase n=1 Tax=Vibrio ulleungensis TaxID=2807619 RepID=A0ABS2HI92_9VIBR|nr:GGDEF domain-containing protein [Vibrio ulleungensis]MBM7035562.1 GGDEF domain-containing protein [Vibrio ulleungensis]
MASKLSKSSSFNFALILSSIGYFLFLATTGSYFVSSNLKEFEVITKEMDNHKQKIIMMGLLAESELAGLSDKDPQQVNESIVPSYQDHIYTLENTQLTIEEAVARKVMHRSIRHLSRFINNPSILLMYRSFSGEKYILQRPIDGFHLEKSLFSEERCVITHVCAKYAYTDQLADRIIVSGVYTDAITSRPVISISAPVVSSKTPLAAINNKDIVGEYIVDQYLDDDWLKDKTIEVEYEGRKKYIHIRYGHYWLSDIAFTSNYVADNMTTFVYSYPVSKLLSEHLVFFAIMFCTTFLLHLKVRESNVRKSQLDVAITSATVDELTGLYNRKIFTAQEFDIALSESGSAIIAIDGNRIKSINDQYGHHAGDEAIKHIASSMKSVFRKSDFLVRSGGDEFIAILPRCSRSRATQLADKLQSKVQSDSVTSHRFTVGIACGVTYKELHEPLDHALLRADERLYEHKSQLTQAQ